MTIEWQNDLGLPGGLCWRRQYRLDRYRPGFSVLPFSARMEPMSWYCLQKGYYSEDSSVKLERKKTSFLKRWKSTLKIRHNNFEVVISSLQVLFMLPQYMVRNTNSYVTMDLRTTTSNLTSKDFEMTRRGVLGTSWLVFICNLIGHVWLIVSSLSNIAEGLVERQLG